MAAKAGVEDLFRALKAQINADDGKAIVETCKRLLAVLPGDADVLRVYGAALLQTGQFQACIDALQSQSPASGVGVLERAYAHYRLNQLPQAQQLLGAVPAANKPKAALHLEAQVAYRLGAFHKSVEIYEKSFFPIDKKDHELRTNVMAAYIGAGAPEKALALVGGLNASAQGLATYELAYNLACAQIDINSPAAAQQSLDVARKLARESLADLSPAELADELAVVDVQSAYALQMAGQTEAAHKIYTDVLNAKPSDSSVVATASNNIITLRKMNEKVFDSLKRSNKAVNLSDYKLSPRQKSAIHLNRCLLILAGSSGSATGNGNGNGNGKDHKKDQNHKGAAAAAAAAAAGDEDDEKSAAVMAEQLRKEFPDSEFPALVLAAMHFNQKNIAKCEETLQTYIRAYPSNSLQSQLTLAHIPLTQGKVPDALKALLAIQPLAHRPAVVATAMALYERQSDLAAAGKVIDSAVAFWSAQKDDAKLPAGAATPARGAAFSAKHTLNVLLEKAAEFRLKHKMYSEAVGTFERLVKAGQSAGKQQTAAEADDTARSISTLVLAASKLDADNAARALAYAAQLPVLPGAEGLRAAAAIAALEASSAPRSDAARRIRKGKGADAKDAKADAKDQKDGGKAGADKKKKRKKRLPKGYDPAKFGAPDPERWLPRWQRKSGKKFRRVRKDKQREFRGPQGATLSAAEAAATVSAGDTKDATAAGLGTPSAAKPTVNLRTAQKAAKRSKGKNKKGGW